MPHPLASRCTFCSGDEHYPVAYYFPIYREHRMRDLFPGYFAPTEKEFAELWREAIFGFDASVLLGLYRLSIETRQVFFEVLGKLGERIFLPNRAAHEYLRNRLAAISARGAFYEGMKTDALKFGQNLEARAQEHSLPKGEEIVKIAKDAARKIAEIADAALKKEPDLIHSDDVLDRLTTVFAGKTGPPYEPSGFDDLCKKAATRYASKIPPGYKDDNKGEPDKYGDVVIWFQLIDHAKSTGKPMIFITRDAKEDWWLQHKGETIGPRPELVQEMKLAAGMCFHMYTMQRFLEFAQVFFKLKAESTKKATSEIEEIEKQDRRAASQGIPAWAWVGQAMPFNSVGYLTNVSYGNNAMGYGSTVGWQVPTEMTWHLGPPAPKAGSTEEEATKSTHFQLLPINGHVFSSSTGKWTCEITSAADVVASDRICYRLKFQPEDRTRTAKELTLWVSTMGLRHDSDWRYKNAVVRIIGEWLDSGNPYGEITYPT
jgi:hypothetical protein